MDSTAPIRSRAAEEGNFEIPLWGVPLILLVLYVCLFSGLGAIGLVGPDEPRYAAIARAMAETHDWITPRLWGTPWFEKPVLYYWTAGIAMRVFGVSEFAARLPSALATLLAVVAIAWTALRSYGLGAAWYSLLMLPTSVAMIGFSRAAAPDMLFAGFLTAAMAVACEILQKPRPGPVLRVAFGFFLGAAVLAKGPAAVILAGGATLLWAALSRQWLAPFRFLHPLIVAVFCATALPWYVLCAVRNPDFLRVFIWQHNFERYLTPVFQHPQPFWFFPAIFVVGILPWLPLAIPGIVEWTRAMRSAELLSSPSLYIGCWIVFIVVFFSLSQSKLPGYILPAFPAAGLLVARTFARVSARGSLKAALAVATAAVIFPVTIGVEYVKPGLTFGPGIGFEPDPSRGVRICLAVAMLGFGFVAAFAFRRKWNPAISSVACTVVFLLLVANHMIMPAVDEFISARPAATFLLRHYNATPDEVAVYGLPRAVEYGLDYYFGRELPQWRPENAPPPFLFYGKTALENMNVRVPYFTDRTAGAFGITPVTLDGKILLRTGPVAAK